MAKMRKCHVSNKAGADVVTIEAALRERRETGRFNGFCIVCQERVIAHKASKYGEAHFEHPRDTRPAEGPARDKWIARHADRKNETR